MELMRKYKARRDALRPKLVNCYEILGFISSGTYGRVYKARSRDSTDQSEYAIKAFKVEKEGESGQITTGISQSACREIALCRELSHINIMALREVLTENHAIYMVLEYAEHDLLQILQFHGHEERKPLPELTVKSCLWQLLNGLSYLHANWILHRDLKPANILVTNKGVVKIGDLGLARVYRQPLLPLADGDRVVVTVWYRAPELLLGAKHYTTTIDIWAVGCIFAELLTLRPIFKSEEVKMDGRKTPPFQKHQMSKIIEVLGTPTVDRWPAVADMPEYPNLASIREHDNALRSYWKTCSSKSDHGYDILRLMLEYDPERRISAEQALDHAYFHEEPRPASNVFANQGFKYPTRKLTKEERPGVKALPPLAAKRQDAGTTSVGGPSAGGANPMAAASSARKKPRIDG
ncbi:Serine/threonine-protein kinase SSN3 [Syncephalis pseudoplumigaleata]|uniref:Cyclin-dependent kinase 8 n=1 Tax=Syncephalis pseudoplumigaleata TaxID=1712513 RepID=A0A4P9YZZ1_9FUNG|nr:Serine/threonine-protein kinase SSN3 [Syncephalis pseudoplumigaleata]|eukprot:RKP25716.1 Serine/threonine-protein kinase SSN3 [Syncephalis pseudoplumigaleata]